MSVTMNPAALATVISGSPCTIILMGLNQMLVQNILKHSAEQEFMGENLESPVVSITDAIDFDMNPLVKTSSCFLGLSDIENFGMLQENLFATRIKQLIVISTNKVNLTDVPQINPFHHPTSLLSETNRGEIKLQTVCHDGNTLTTDIFRSEATHWVVSHNGRLYGPDFMERLCNNGHLPLHGKTIRASVFSTKPFIYSDGNGNINGGVLVDMLKILAEYLEFDFELILRDYWYHFYPNGTIGESLGDVLYGKADVSLEQFMGLASSFGDISITTFFDFDIFIELKPKELPKFSNIVRPLDDWTWTCLAITLGTVTVILYVVQLQGNLDKNMSMSKVLQLTYGIIFQEYYLSSSLRKSTKFVQIHMAWVVLTTFLTMAFMGNLKSSLIRKSFEKRTMNISEIVDKDMIVHASAPIVDWWKTPMGQLSPINKRLLCQVEKTNSTFEFGSHNYIEKASELLFKHGGAADSFVYAMKDFKSQYLKRGIDYPIIDVPERTKWFYYAMFFNKYDPRVNYFNKIIWRMTDMGISDYLLRRALPYQDMKEAVKLEEEKLTIELFYLPLIFWSVGLAAGIFVFISEFCHQRMSGN